MRNALGLVAIALVAPAAIADLVGAATGDIVTVAGTGVAGSAGDGGAALAAQLQLPVAIAVSRDGTTFVAEGDGSRVRRIDTAGAIDRAAGTGIPGYSGDGGSALEAQFDGIAALAVDRAGNLFIADAGNNRVRRVDRAGVVVTVAGNGRSGTSTDGPATEIHVDAPAGLAFDSAGNLFISEPARHRVRKLDGAGMISTYAGTGAPGFSGDGGSAASARLREPGALATDATGALYVADAGNYRVRKVDSSGVITTVAGNGTDGFGGDGGPARDASLSAATGLHGDAELNLFFSDGPNHRVRRVANDGTIASVAGTGASGFSGDGGSATAADLSSPAGLGADAGGNLLIADSGNHRVRRIEGISRIVPAPLLESVVPNSPANDNAPRLRGDAAEGSTVWIHADPQCATAPVATGTAASLRDPGLTVTVPDDSATSFWASATNAYGATSLCSPASVTFVEDSTPPATPLFTVEPATPAANVQPAWSFSAEEGAATACELRVGLRVVAPFESCSGSLAFDLSDQADAVYTLAVKATDAAGNIGPEATSSYVLDRAAPLAPVLISVAPSPSNVVAPGWRFTTDATATATECWLERGGVALALPAPCAGSWTASLGAQPDGAYRFHVRSRDAAGNASAPATADYLLDRSPPAPPDITEAPRSPTSSSLPVWHFSAEAGASTWCSLSGSAGVLAPEEPCEGGIGYDLSTQPDGEFTFAVAAVDAAGNRGPAASSVVLVDRTAPVPPQVTRTGGDEYTPDYDIAPEVGTETTCELLIDGAPARPAGPCEGATSFDLTGLEPGVYTLRVTSIDGAGNSSTSTVLHEIRPPVAPVAPDAPSTVVATAPAPAQRPVVRQSGAAPSPAPRQFAPAPTPLAGPPSPRVPPAPPLSLAPVPVAPETPSVSAPVVELAPTAGPRRIAARPLPHAGDGAFEALQLATSQAARRSAFPLSLLLIVLLFLIAQDHVDRRDPKLALAPLRVDSLSFTDYSRRGA